MWFQKPAGSDLGSFFMIYDFLYENFNFSMDILISPMKISVFLMKNLNVFLYDFFNDS